MPVLWAGAASRWRQSSGLTCMRNRYEPRAFARGSPAIGIDAILADTSPGVACFVVQSA